MVGLPELPKSNVSLSLWQALLVHPHHSNHWMKRFLARGFCYRGPWISIAFMCLFDFILLQPCLTMIFQCLHSCIMPVCIHHRLHILGNGCGKAIVLWRRTFHRMGALRWLHLRCESAFVVDLLPFLNISQCIHLLSRWNIQFAMLGEKKKIDANQFCDHLGSNKNLRWIEWIR